MRVLESQTLRQILAVALQVASGNAFYNVRVLRANFAILIVVLATGVMGHGQQQAAQPFAISTSGLPNGVIGEIYKIELKQTNGVAPIVWQVSGGQFPPGLNLDRNTGVITGTPTQIGTFAFTIRASDGSNASVNRRYVVNIGTRTLNIVWKDYPKVDGTSIAGGVEVQNPSDDPYDLTVIIVAVDEHNKAWALGYQHFTFPALGRQQIPFGSSLPDGSYVVNADAVGEIAAKNVIRRARIVTPQSLTVHNISSGPIGSKLR